MAARGIFLTGTDTGAGKTLVSCAILAALSRRGLRVAAFKPVETGCRGDVGARIGEDCERLAAAARSGQQPSEVAAYLFAEPAAPLVAAEAEGVVIDRAVILARFEAIAASAEFVLVESAGGLMVPLSAGYTTRDLAGELGLPAVCVVASRLGCINHALLSVQALFSAGIATAGFVMNEIHSDGAHELAHRTNRDVIGRFSEVPDLGVMPFVDAGRREDLDFLASVAERCLDLHSIAGTN
jgi:dethiobiotin synthetase